MCPIGVLARRSMIWWLDMLASVSLVQSRLYHMPRPGHCASLRSQRGSARQAFRTARASGLAGRLRPARYSSFHHCPSEHRIGKALVDPTVRQRLFEAAQDPVGGTPEQLASLVAEDFEKYGRLA